MLFICKRKYKKKYMSRKLMHSVCVDIRDAANNKVNLEKYTDRPAITGNGQSWAATSTSKTACTCVSEAIPGSPFLLARQIRFNEIF